MLNVNTSISVCCNIGVSGITPCMVRQTGDEFEARMGISFLGSAHMSDAELDACGRDPFHDDFLDNFASGKGPTSDEAIAALREDMKKMAETLWM